MPRSLTEYQRKRDFAKTPEPKGTPEPSGKNRFVVQKHWATRLHYDFRLEMEGVLVSWAIPKGPTLNPAERRLAAHVEDHPVGYFDFEGLIPKGEYGGGTVMVWDWGTYDLEESTPAESLRRGEVKFRLNGERLKGRYALVRTRSGRGVDQEYPQLQAITRSVNLKQAVLDGEVVALDDEGRPSFQLLQNRGREPVQLQYVVFDIVYADGQQLFKVPLDDRKRLLHDAIKETSLLKYSDHVVGEGKAFFRAAKTKRLEGIVAKLRDSLYLPGVRSSSWLKIKTVAQQEVVIGGFTAPRASRKYFGAILVGVYDDEGNFVYVGHTGGGCDEKTLRQVYELMKPMITKNPPFSGKPPRTNEKPTWVRPELVCEVKFSEWTRDGVMRHRVFLGLRDDVDPRAVRREKPAAADRGRRSAERAAVTTTAARTRKTASRTTVIRRAAPTRRTSTQADVPDTPLSRAAAAISKKLGTNVRGATATELAALDAIKKDGHWEIGGRSVHLTNLDKLLFPEDRYSTRDLIRYYR